MAKTLEQNIALKLSLGGKNEINVFLDSLQKKFSNLNIDFDSKEAIAEVQKSMETLMVKPNAGSLAAYEKSFKDLSENIARNATEAIDSQITNMKASFHTIKEEATTLRAQLKALETNNIKAVMDSEAMMTSKKDLGYNSNLSVGSSVKSKVASMVGYSSADTKGLTILETVKKVQDQITANIATQDGLETEKQTKEKAFLLLLEKGLADSESYKATQEKITRNIKEQQDITNSIKTAEGERTDTLLQVSSLTASEISDAQKLGRLKLEQADADRANQLTEKEANQDRIKNLLAAAAIWQSVKRLISEVINVTKELDASINEIAIVTNMSQQEAWQLFDSFNNIANIVGTSTQDISDIAAQYYRQGKQTLDVMILTEATAKAAKVAGISAADSVNYLTAALNGYNLAADQALVVSDKFAALGASAATSYEEMAIAFSKVGAQAASAGVEMDSLMGFMAKALETTR